MTQTRSYIRVTWVAQAYNKPIVTAHTWEDLLLGLDDYYQSDGERLRFIHNDTQYVDSFDGYFEYEVDDYNGGKELERVDVFCVDFYPHTKYEKVIAWEEDAPQAIDEEDEDYGTYDDDDE